MLLDVDMQLLLVLSIWQAIQNVKVKSNYSIAEWILGVLKLLMGRAERLTARHFWLDFEKKKKKKKKKKKQNLGKCLKICQYESIDKYGGNLSLVQNIAIGIYESKKHGRTWHLYKTWGDKGIIS